MLCYQGPHLWLVVVASFLVPTYAYLMLALGLLGFGFGGSLSPLCILLAEVLPIQRRGFFLANSTVAFQIGSVLITDSEAMANGLKAKIEGGDFTFEFAAEKFSAVGH